MSLPKSTVRKGSYENWCVCWCGKAMEKVEIQTILLGQTFSCGAGCHEGVRPTQKDPRRKKKKVKTDEC